MPTNHAGQRPAASGQTLHPIIASMLADHPVLAPVVPALLTALDRLRACRQRDGWIFTCGNGGSAADADHIVGELLKGFRLPRRTQGPALERLRTSDPAWEALAPRLQWGIRACCLNAHAAALSAIANDQHPDLIFAQQIVALGRPGDVLIGLSTSGDSVNVVRAMQTARALGLTTIALTGSRTASLDAVADVALKAPASETWRVQEQHLPLYHALCALLEAETAAGNG